MATRREFIKKAAIAATAVAAASLVDTACAQNTKKMKVLMINGSPHQNGNTATALQEAAAQLKENGIDSEIVWIGNAPVHGCIACGHCKSQEPKCIFDDDICNQVAAKMKESDALIVGSPVYYGQPNGAVLAIVQRLCYSSGGALSGKPAAAFAVCRRGGATASFQTMNMPFMMMNMPVVTSQYWNIGYGQSQGQIAQDAEGMQTMRTLANNMAALLKATGGKPMPGPSERTTFTNFIK